MGLLDKLKSLLFGKEAVREGKQDAKPGAKPADEAIVEKPVEQPVAAKPAEDKVEQVEQKHIIQKPKEEKPVADKITVGHVHMSGCTGCLVSLADNYEGLLTILDKYADLV
ncbi:MAG TPA: coenzyme F420 hydrogenase subunit gamma, partial [Methanocorpusculum sp.]|nr:coenzyme F420 hydrogenase subunit gamma [Methanocorpusculum sp.]